MIDYIHIESFFAQKCYEAAKKGPVFASWTIYHSLDAREKTMTNVDEIQALIEEWVEVGIASEYRVSKYYCFY